MNELAPMGSALPEVLAAERRAFAEISPEGRPWTELVATWPEARQRRFRNLARDFEAAGEIVPSNERLAFLAIAAEDDPPGLELRDPVAAILAAAG